MCSCRQCRDPWGRQPRTSASPGEKNPSILPGLVLYGAGQPDVSLPAVGLSHGWVKLDHGLGKASDTAIAPVFTGASKHAGVISQVIALNLVSEMYFERSCDEKEKK